MTILYRERMVGSIKFVIPYYDDYTIDKDGQFLPKDFAAHALFNYFMLASKAYHDVEKRLVYEKDLSPRFPLDHAKNLFTTIANIHGVSPMKMSQYWDAVDKQRRALGFSLNADIPEAYKFKGGWSN